MDLQEATGPEPEPEMAVGLLVAGGPDADLDALQAFAAQLGEDVRAEMESVTGLQWRFFATSPMRLRSDKPQRPSDFVDEASQRMAQGPFDLVVVVTDLGLTSRRRHIVAGLASPTLRMAVVSVRKLLNQGGRAASQRLDDSAVRWNSAALLLHLLGHFVGLHHGGRMRSAVMRRFEFRSGLERLPRFAPHERQVFARVGERLPERELRGGDALAGLVFHVLMALRHPLDGLRPLLRNRALLMPLSLPGLATAAVAPCFLLVFTAEIWDVGLGMSNRLAALYAMFSILAASFYLVRAQSLLLPRRERRLLTEHLAVTNAVIYLSIVLACIGLFLIVAALMMVIAVWIFPQDLIQTWPTLNYPQVSLEDKLRLAAFIATVGVSTGALAGGLESRAVVRHLACLKARNSVRARMSRDAADETFRPPKDG